VSRERSLSMDRGRDRRRLRSSRSVEKGERDGIGCRERESLRGRVSTRIY